MRPFFAPALLLLVLGRPAFAEGQGERNLTLDEALDALIEKNPNLAMARAQADQARGVARQASAALQPVLGAQGSYALNNEEVIVSFNNFVTALEEAVNQLVSSPVTFDRSGIPADLVMQPKDVFTAGASLRVPLFNASAWADLKAARQAVDAYDKVTEATALQATRLFIEACWLASATDGMVEAASHATESARQHRDATTRRREAGLATQLEVLRAETELARRESDLAEARSNVDRAKIALGALLGEAGSVTVTMPEPGADSALESRSEAELLELAMADRPELAARQAEMDARQAQLRSAHLRHLPTLNASGTLFASDEPYPTGQSWGWKLGAELTWVAYDGGFRYGKAQEARGALAGATANRTAAELQVDQEVRQARRDLGVARERLELATHARQLANDAEQAAQRGFEAGLVSSLEVLDAQDRRYAAEVGYQQARAYLGAADARLRAATATGW